jgi:hypothetical protein
LSGAGFGWSLCEATAVTTSLCWYVSLLAMSKTTNPIILFVGGLLLGVLIAMGFIARMNNSSEAPADQVLDIHNNSGSSLFNMPNPIESIQGMVAPAVAAVAVTPGTHSPPPKTTETESPPSKVRPRWAPGKPGSFGGFGTQVQDGGVTENAPPAASGAASATDSAGGTGLTKKQLRQAALLQKRQQQKLLNAGNTGEASSSSTAPAASTATAALVSTVAPRVPQANKESTSKAAAAPPSNAVAVYTASGGAGDAGLSSKTALPAHAQRSVYSNTKIEKAVAAYHGQAVRDNSHVTPYIPSYSAAAAAK